MVLDNNLVVTFLGVVELDKITKEGISKLMIALLMYCLSKLEVQYLAGSTPSCHTLSTCLCSVRDLFEKGQESTSLNLEADGCQPSKVSSCLDVRHLLRQFRYTLQCRWNYMNPPWHYLLGIRCIMPVLSCMWIVVWI